MPFLKIMVNGHSLLTVKTVIIPRPIFS